MFETRTWLTKAKARKIISEELYTSLLEKLKLLHQKLNAYILSINKNIK
jgi:hypothetical protein